MMKVHQRSMILWKKHYPKSWCFSILSTTHRNEKYSNLTWRHLQKDSQCFKSSRNYDESSPTVHDPMEKTLPQIMVLFNIVDHPSHLKMFELRVSPPPER